MNCGVYTITNQRTGSVYVGSSTNLRQRWAAHLHLLRAGRHPSAKLQEAFARDGEPAFCMRPVLACSPENRRMYEEIVIGGMNAVEAGYNTRQVRGYQHSEVTRARISAGLQGKRAGKPLPSEWAANIRAALNRPEVKARISASSTGRVPSAETLAKRSAALTGRVNTPEAIENMRRAQANRKPLTAEARARMSESAKRRHARAKEAS